MKRRNTYCIGADGAVGVRRALAAALLAVAVCGCSKGGGGGSGEDDDPGTPVQIELRANVISKSPSSDETFIPSVAGWEAAKTQADYSLQPTWSTVTAGSISVNASYETASLATPQFYNKDRRVFTHIRAWYPQGTFQPGGEVQFTDPAMDGSQEVFYAEPVLGAKFDVITQPLIFIRPLSQLKVSMVKKADVGDVKVKRIVLKDAKIAQGYNVATGVTIYSPQTVDLVLYDDNAGTDTGGVAKSVGRPVMFGPFTGNTAYLDITAWMEDAGGDEFFPSTKFTVDDADFVPGRSYMVTITFHSRTIEAEASISEWEQGSTGDLEIN